MLAIKIQHIPETRDEDEFQLKVSWALKKSPFLGSEYQNVASLQEEKNGKKKVGKMALEASSFDASDELQLFAEKHTWIV